MRYGEKIYLAQYDKEQSSNGILIYKKPICFVLRPNYLSVQPASGYTSIVEYGKDITKVWHLIANSSRFSSVFKEGDLLYLDGANPQGESDYGENANGIIDNVSSQNMAIRVVIKKRAVDD